MLRHRCNNDLFIPHTQCVVAIALSVADAFRKYHKIELNRDYLIAAAVL